MFHKIFQSSHGHNDIDQHVRCRFRHVNNGVLSLCSCKSDKDREMSALDTVDTDCSIFLNICKVSKKIILTYNITNGVSISFVIWKDIPGWDIVYISSNAFAWRAISLLTKWFDPACVTDKSSSTNSAVRNILMNTGASSKISNLSFKVVSHAYAECKSKFLIIS